MNKKIIYIIAGALILAFICLILSFCGFFLPVYEYNNNSVIVDKISYGFEPTNFWRPKGDNAVKIGRVKGYDSSFPVFLYKFQDNDYFVIVQPMITDLVQAPMHRQDIILPFFSADIMNSVELTFDPRMLREYKEIKTVKVTDHNSIAALEDCFSKPKKSENIEYYKPFIFLAESDRYKGIYFSMETTVYNNQYCLTQGDGTVYEIPLPLLEQISGLKLLSPAEYLENIKNTRE